MSLSKKYKKSEDCKWALRFHTVHPEGCSINGVVTDTTRRFIVLREITNLDFDGVVILPKRVLKGYRDSSTEKCVNNILRYTGNIKKAQTPKWLKNCNSLRDVIRQLVRKDIWPIVEILFEFEGELISDFYIGRIMDLDEDGFTMLPYDATGKWEDDYWIEYGEIFKIEFLDSYSTAFNQYMRNL